MIDIVGYHRRAQGERRRCRVDENDLRNGHIIPRGAAKARRT
jgi:hypothetical protein